MAGLITDTTLNPATDISAAGTPVRDLLRLPVRPTASESPDRRNAALCRQ
jgi:hypothetical protein